MIGLGAGIEFGACTASRATFFKAIPPFRQIAHGKKFRSGNEVKYDSTIDIGRVPFLRTGLIRGECDRADEIDPSRILLTTHWFWSVDPVVASFLLQVVAVVSIGRKPESFRRSNATGFLNEMRIVSRTAWQQQDRSGSIWTVLET